mgnify:CR=1 FL=1
MCIRDRLSIDDINKFKASFLFISCCNINFKLVAFMPSLNSCLLYTSDAADERSSVDLGGRRIIKKKKKHKLTSNHNAQIINLIIHIDKQSNQKYKTKRTII